MVDVKGGTFISAVRDVNLLKGPVKVSLGPRWVGPDGTGRSLPKANPHDQRNVWLGSLYRFARKPPVPCQTQMKQLRRFTADWLNKYLPPLTEVMTFEEWLEEAPYPQSRKEQLRAAWDECQLNGGPLSKAAYTRVKSFQKDEVYVDWKYPRAINSRHDVFKCASAPFFKAIEKVLFARPEFIKKVPVRDRPSFILDRLYKPGCKYMATDYTAFESLFTEELMMTLEMQLYKHMTQHLPEGREWYQLIESVLTGTNHIRFKHFIMKVVATRMSGEMCTSLGNSFANLMLALYVLDQNGTKDALGVVEGDDGLFRVDGTMPTKEDFEKLGLLIKIEEHDDVATASFCGLIFDRHDLANITDPKEVLADYGWTSNKYLRASDKTHKYLLRAKSLSLLYQYCGMPIVQALALYGLRHTHGLSNMKSIRTAMKNTNQYEVGIYLEMMTAKLYPTTIGHNTRMLVESKYGVTVQQQIDIERYLSTADFGPLVIDLDAPRSWIEYDRAYVTRAVQLADGTYSYWEPWHLPKIRQCEAPPNMEPDDRGGYRAPPDPPTFGGVAASKALA